MIPRQILQRAKRALLVILVGISVSTAYSLSITIGNGGNWSITQTSFTMPTIAGDNLTPTTLTSATNQANLDVKTKKNDPMWTVSVQRTTTSWYSGVHVWAQRTSTHTNVAGGTSYIEVTSTAQTFFYSTAIETSALNTYIQLQLTGLSAFMGCSNSTTITYTLTAN